MSSLALLAVVGLTGANKGPIKKLTHDPEAPVVKLFDGIEDGTYEVRVVPRNEFLARVYITNTTDAPKTVELPKAVVGVHVLKQFFPQQGIPGSSIGNQLGSQTGSGQDVGGNLQSTGSSNQFPFSGTNGNNFFSIPPESIVQLQLNSVCLNHGNPTPQPKMKYELRRLEERVKSRALRQLLAGYNPQRIDRKIMQAAAWHLANNMSWQELANKKVGSVGLRPRRFIALPQLKVAMQLVEAAEKNTKADKNDDETRTKSRVAESRYMSGQTS